jgi:hypothetical protein
MEHKCFVEADSRSSSRFPRILCKSVAYYGTHKSSPLDMILTQVIPAIPYFC